jgi:hypothetical protein
MKQKGGGKPADDVPYHLQAAHDHLLMALVHLAAVDGDLRDEDLAFPRRSIAASIEKVQSIRQRSVH